MSSKKWLALNSEHKNIGNFKELRNKKISLENSSAIKNHIVNQDLICVWKESMIKYTVFENLKI